MTSKPKFERTKPHSPIQVAHIMGTRTGRLSSAISCMEEIARSGVLQGSPTGRLTSPAPELQEFPKLRTEEATRLRDAWRNTPGGAAILNVWNQATETGRISSNAPNDSNVPRPGVSDMDFSAIEERILAGMQPK